MYWWWVLASVALVALTSLSGAIFYFIDEKRLSYLNRIFVSFAVGSIFGNVFLHLIPEIFESGQDNTRTSVLILGGIFLFFLFEKTFHWQHEHSPEHVHPVGYMNIAADAFHSMIDGSVIALAYSQSFSIGTATTVAIFLHELPQEIGEFGILLHAGFSKRKALVLNVCSGLLAFVGVLVVFLVGDQSQHLSSIVLPLVTGALVYVAGSDLMPALHKEGESKQTGMQLIAMIAGSALMLLIK